MRQAEKLYDSITNVREEYLEEARKPEYAEITKDVGRIEDSGAKEPGRKLPARLFGSALTDDLWEIYRIFIPAKFSNFVE